MGSRLEASNSQSKEIRHNVDELNVQGEMLNKESEYVGILDSLEHVSDEDVADAIRESKGEHISEVKRVQDSKREQTERASQLQETVSAQIHNLEDYEAKLEMLGQAEHQFGNSERSKAINEAQKQVLEWKRISTELMAIQAEAQTNYKPSIKDFFSGGSAESKNIQSIEEVNRSLENVQTEINNATVKSDVFGFFQSLSPEQKEAVSIYTSSGHKSINRHLRSGEPISAEGEEYINNLRSALCSSRLRNGVTVYRGVDSDALPYGGNISDEDLVGKVMIDRGFMSTSFSIDTAREFSHENVFVIDAPAGSQGTYVGEMSSVPWEDELLFNSNSIMKIKSVERDESGTRIIHMIML